MTQCSRGSCQSRSDSRGPGQAGRRRRGRRGGEQARGLHLRGGVKTGRAAAKLPLGCLAALAAVARRLSPVLRDHEQLGLKKYV